MQVTHPGQWQTQEEREWLEAALQATLRDLTRIDLALSAAELSRGNVHAAIWRALANQHPTLDPVLETPAPLLATLSHSRPAITLAHIAPLTLDLYDVVPGESASTVRFLTARYRQTPSVV